VRRPHPREGRGLRRVALGVALLLAVSCGGRSTPSATTAAPAVTVGPNTTGEAVRDGRIFAEVDSIDASKREVQFDVAEFLTGDAAEKAAADEGGEVNNDYYIRNTTKRSDVLPFSDDVEVKVVDWDHCCKVTDGDLATLAKSFESGGRYDDDAGGSGPFFLTVRGGMVVKIEEQYLP
jgi:hypothetical protein